jgi:predicted DNA-binding mobile mystery protein A
MKAQFKELRLKQLGRSLAAFMKAQGTPRPKRGWLRAIREATGLSLTKVGKAIGATRSHVQALEKSEAAERITLRSLKKVAAAMNCELLYAIVPKSGTLEGLVEKRAYQAAATRVRAVEHTMALEDQAAGGVREKIEEEARRILKRS